MRQKEMISRTLRDGIKVQLQETLDRLWTSNKEISVNDKKIFEFDILEMIALTFQSSILCDIEKISIGFDLIDNIIEPIPKNLYTFVILSGVIPIGFNHKMKKYESSIGMFTEEKEDDKKYYNFIPAYVTSEQKIQGE